jgi:hypothetical protein
MCLCSSVTKAQAVTLACVGVPEYAGRQCSCRRSVFGCACALFVLLCEVGRDRMCGGCPRFYSCISASSCL